MFFFSNLTHLTIDLFAAAPSLLLQPTPAPLEKGLRLLLIGQWELLGVELEVATHEPLHVCSEHGGLWATKVRHQLHEPLSLLYRFFLGNHFYEEGHG